MCGVAAGDDIVQETFLAVLSQGGRFDPAKVRCRRTSSGARHHVIRRLDRQGVTLSEPVEVVASDAIALQDTPLETMARERMIGAVRQAVQSLPACTGKSSRSATCRRWTTLPSPRSFNVRSGQAWSRLHRARGLLLRKLSVVPSMAMASRV